MNDDGKQTATNFNQTLHDVNTLNKNFDIKTNSKEFAKTAGEKQPNNLTASIEM